MSCKVCDVERIYKRFRAVLARGGHASRRYRRTAKMPVTPPAKTRKMRSVFQRLIEGHELAYVEQVARSMEHSPGGCDSGSGPRACSRHVRTQRAVTEKSPLDVYQSSIVPDSREPLLRVPRRRLRQGQGRVRPPRDRRADPQARAVAQGAAQHARRSHARRTQAAPLGPRTGSSSSTGSSTTCSASIRAQSRSGPRHGASPESRRVPQHGARICSASTTTPTTNSRRTIRASASTTSAMR